MWPGTSDEVRKDIHEIDRLGQLGERAAHRVSEQRLADELRVDAEDLVALVVKILGHVERGLLRLDVDAEHRDRRRTGEDRTQAGVVDGRDPRRLHHGLWIGWGHGKILSAVVPSQVTCPWEARRTLAGSSEAAFPA